MDLSGQAEASKAINEVYRLPPTFAQDSSGLIVPERLRRPSAELIITGKVNDDMFRKVAEDINKIERESGNKEALNVSFLSDGGNMYSGFGVHGILRSFKKRHNATVTITGYGAIMSMASLIIQAGSIRRMEETATLMLHPSFHSFSGTPEEARARVEQADVLAMRYAEIVAERVRDSGRGELKDVNADTIRDIMYAGGGAGSYLSAQQALEYGLIDEIV